MIYALTGHSLWNHVYHPFLLCSCQRGDGVLDSNHKCTMLSEKIRVFDKSLCKYTEKKYEDLNYDETKYCHYTDKSLKGCTHYRFSPTDLKHSSSRFDMIHLRAFTTRKL